MLRVKNILKEGKKKHCEKIHIEKLKELALSSKSESAQERTQQIHENARRWFTHILWHV